MRLLRSLVLIALAAVPAAAQPRLTTPESALGFGIGADYRLATYTQLHRWWERLASESPRMILDTIGMTAEGRPQVMAIISAPANLARREEYRRISEQLARGRIDESTARRLASDGKAIIWIDGGLHATEVLGAHQLMETVWQFVSQDDPETMRILDDVIILAVHANPDGQELVSSWYMRTADSSRRTYASIPRLYQKYIGHDNNRDFYRNAQAESKNLSRALYREWYPQIMYNHHQTGPAGAVMFAPPFRDPFNYVYDPMIPTGLDFVGAAMHRRFAAEGKGGTVSRDAANYSTWWNGGLRTTAYFHNIIGILTETIGSPTPMQVPLRYERQLPAGGQALPVQWGTWRFRQSIDYSMTANRSILDLASRYREDLLFNIWRMGRNSIDRGGRDSWTHTPGLIADAIKAATNVRPDTVRAGVAGARGPQSARVDQGARAGEAVLRSPARRDPRAYVIPAGQAEMGAALDFLQALSTSGIEINRATAAFSVGSIRYPAGSFVVRGDQAFRPHVLDMFEPQDHPTDLQYPGGPPKAPYDNAGWTLAYQMGFKFDRLLDAFDAPLELIADEMIRPTATPFDTRARSWRISPTSTDAYLAVNRLARANQRVERADNGDFIIRASSASAKIINDLVQNRGLPVSIAPDARGTQVRPLRVGLWDRYGGSMESGWTRWILEQYETPFELVYSRRLDAGDLRKDFDVLIFVDGAIPGFDPPGVGGGGGLGQQDTTSIPAELRAQLGRVSVATTVPHLKAFLQAGGRVITIGSSTALAQHLALPIENHLVEKQVDGTTRAIPRDRYYVPGSILEVAVDSTQPSAWGAASVANVMFDNSPVFRLAPDAAARGVTPIAWFASASPLRSGWAHGQGYLQGGVTMASARVGQGMLYLYGPEVLFRAQPTGTYRFVFNALYGPTRP